MKELQLKNAKRSVLTSLPDEFNFRLRAVGLNSLDLFFIIDKPREDQLVRSLASKQPLQ